MDPIFVLLQTFPKEESGEDATFGTVDVCLPNSFF